MKRQNLAKDELIGLQVKIIECKDSDWVGKSGMILDETKNTFLIKTKDKEKTIAKAIAKRIKKAR